MMAAPGLDQRGPFLELGEAGCAVGLGGEERGEGVGWWELEGCCEVRLRHLFVSGREMRPILILRVRGLVAVRYGGLLVG
jgi:hypothetical protein